MGRTRDDRDGAEQLTEALRTRKWSLRKAAAELGCSAGTVCRWTKRQSFPGKVNVRTMHEKLGIPPAAWYSVF